MTQRDPKNFTGSADGADAVLFTTPDVSSWLGFMLTSTAGAVYVEASLDGSSWTTAPIALQDLGGTTTDPVLVTVAGRMYGIVGNYRNLRVKQSGATASAAVLRAFNP